MSESEQTAAADQSQQTSGTETTQQAETTSTQAERPEWLPEDHWDAENGSLNWESFGEHYRSLAETAAAQQSQAATLPESPEGYELSLPEGFDGLPEGSEFKIDDDSFIAKSVREWAASHKVPQEAVKDLVGVYAKDLMNAAQANLDQAKEALGARADERLEAVENWLGAQGLSAEEHNAFADVLVSAPAVQALEKIMARTSRSAAANAGSSGETITENEVLQLQSSKEYMRGDPAVHQKVSDFYRKKHGNQPFRA